MTYHADMDRLRNTWFGLPVIANAEDLFRVTINMGRHGEITADTHLFNNSEFRIIPYCDFDSMSRDAGGHRHSSGDAALTTAIPAGKIAFSIKHHRCQNRLLSQHFDANTTKENLKLQDSHIQMVVGVEDRGRGQPGVVTLNSPQSYGHESGAIGRFGTADYPMIFVEPVFPDYLPAQHHVSFIDNIRTMALSFNAVSRFPGNGRYNGGDPLAASSPQQVIQHVQKMILAIAATGQQQHDAIAWFEHSDNLIYCAEYAFLAATAGCLCPLNHSYLEPLVGASVCRNFLSILDRHASGHITPLTVQNPNPLANTIAAAIAPDSLMPLPQYASPEQLEHESTKLAFAPFTAADIVDHAMRIHFDRKTNGESIATVQGLVMQRMMPGFLEMLQLNQDGSNTMQREAAISVYAKLVSVVAEEHSSYTQFRQELQPVLDKARRLTGGRAGRDNLFVPPSLFHIVARHEHHGGLLGLGYMGHGFHLSLVHK